MNGIGAWSEQGIVGRGVLLDYEAWRKETQQDLSHNAFEPGSIPFKDLKAVADWEGLELKFGDILIIRSGKYIRLSDLLSDLKADDGDV